MSASSANSRHESLSKLVDNIFDRYTVVPSSVTDEEEIDELRVSFENLGSSEVHPEHDNHPSDAESRQDGVGKDKHSNNRNSTPSVGRTVDPREIQLPSSSADTGAYARKTIPQTLWETMAEANSPSSSNDIFSPSQSIVNIDSDSDGDMEATTACERCLKNNIECKPNPGTRGIACLNCRSKRRKCTFVPGPKSKPGAAGISTPPDGSFDSFRSELYAFTDSNDESFELDSYRVTLQRVFGKVSYLTKAHEDRFAKLEAQLSRIEHKQDIILKRMEDSGK